jgi:bacteriocin-like protein
MLGGRARKDHTMSDWSEDDEAQIISEVCRRSTVDPDFRTLALTDPASAIAKVTTKIPPPSVKYQFADNTGPVKTIALPDPIPETEELSDKELEQIAGGDYSSQAGYVGN